MLQQIFLSMLVTSFVGGGLIMLLFLFKPVTRRLFSAKWNYYIYLAVLVVLIIPVRFESPYVPGNPGASAESTVEKITPGQAAIQYFQGKDVNIADIEIPKPTVEKLRVSVIYNLKNIIPVIWISVAAFLFMMRLLSYILFLRKLYKNSYSSQCPELKLYTDRNIAVRKSKSLSSPLMAGVFRPVLVLPEAEMPEDVLCNVLKHEMVHFNRCDILYKWLAAIVKCIHWFNPLVWGFPVA